MTDAGERPEARRKRRGRLVALALALAATGVLLAAATLLKDQLAAVWYEHRLERGAPEERGECIRKLAATRTDRGLRRVLRALLEEEQQQEVDRSGTPIHDLVSVDEQGLAGAAQQALASVGRDALPAAAAAIEHVLAGGDAKQIERAARRLGPIVVPLGHLDDWARPITGRWIADLGLAHGPAGKAANKLRELGAASLPGLLAGLDGDESFQERWCESLLWQLAEKDEAACRGLLHAYAQADGLRRSRLTFVLGCTGEAAGRSMERALVGPDPRLSRAAREALDAIAALREVEKSRAAR